MPRKCKCRICGKELTTDMAYKVTSGKVNKYFCSKEEYETELEVKEKEKKIRDDAYYTIYEIFQYQVTNSVLFKELDIIAQIYGFEKIYHYLLDNEAYLTSVMKKEFVHEYAKIRYFAAILKNNLVDYKYEPPKIEPPKEVTVDISDIKYNRSKKRKALIDFEEEVGDES